MRIGHRRRKRPVTALAANEIAPASTSRRNERMRCLGIDHGTRRIGLSFGDELGVATPLPAITEIETAKRWAALEAVVKERRITEIVVGHPLNMDDTVGPK